MEIVKPYIEVLQAVPYNEMKYVTETAIRNCYKSEDKMKPGSAAKIIKGVGKRGHLSTYEHCMISARFVTDCGILAELTRHRTGIGFSVESTRYCNYTDDDKFNTGIKVIMPYDIIGNPEAEAIWIKGINDMETAYNALTALGIKTDSTRSVLAKAVKTDIIVTANIREWLHIFDVRCANPAHYQFRQLTRPFLGWLYTEYPAFFEMYGPQYIDKIEELKNNPSSRIEITDKRFQTLSYEDQKQYDD